MLARNRKGAVPYLFHQHGSRPFGVLLTEIRDDDLYVVELF